MPAEFSAQVRDSKSFYESIMRFMEETQAQLIIARDAYNGELLNTPANNLGELRPKVVDGLPHIELLSLVEITLRESGSNNVGNIKFVFNEFDGSFVPIERSGPISSQTLNALNANFTLVRPKQARLAAADDILGDAGSIAKDSIFALNTASSEIVSEQSAAYKKLEEYLSTATVELVKKYEAAHDKLRAKEEGQTAEHQARLKELAEKEASLLLRESKKERRGLLDRIEELISAQAKFERSQETKDADTAVNQTCIPIAVVGLSVMVGAFWLKWLKDVQDFVFYIPFVSGSLLLGTTCVVLIRYVLIRSRRNTELDFAIMQYSRDMYRMSWLAELLFEAQANEDAKGVKDPVKLPDAIVQQFAHGLFESQKERESAHPLDDLQKQLKRFKKFSIGAQGLVAESTKDDS